MSLVEVVLKASLSWTCGKESKWKRMKENGKKRNKQKRDSVQAWESGWRKKCDVAIIQKPGEWAMLNKQWKWNENKQCFNMWNIKVQFVVITCEPVPSELPERMSCHDNEIWKGNSQICYIHVTSKWQACQWIKKYIIENAIKRECGGMH